MKVRVFFDAAVDLELSEEQYASHSIVCEELQKRLNGSAVTDFDVYEYRPVDEYGNVPNAYKPVYD